MLYDWTKHIIRTTINDYDVIIIPKNSIIYSGKSLKHYLDDGSENIGASFYTTFDVATDYAFNPNLMNSIDPTDYYGVFSYKITKDIVLLDMESSKNYENLHKLSDIPRLKYMNNIDILTYSFNNGNKRYSDVEVDILLINWICKKIEDNVIPVIGYAYTEKMQNHNEIMICSNKAKPKKIENIYRTIPYLDENYIFETKNGVITNKINIKDISYKVNNKVYNININREKSYVVYGGNYDEDIELYKRNKNIDKFMYIKELNNILIEYVYKYFNTDEYKEDYREIFPKSYIENTKLYNKLHNIKGKEKRCPNGYTRDKKTGECIKK